MLWRWKASNQATCLPNTSTVSQNPHAHEDTHALWAMRAGGTLSGAMSSCERKVAALRLFAGETDAQPAHEKWSTSNENFTVRHLGSAPSGKGKATQKARAAKTAPTPSRSWT